MYGVELDDSLRLFGRYCYDIVREDEYIYNDNIVKVSDSHTEYLLRAWQRAKEQYLFKMFGDELILSKHIDLVMSDDDVFYEMEQFVRDEWEFMDLLDNQIRYFTNYYNCSWTERDMISTFIGDVRMLLDAHHLTNGRVPYTFKEFVLNGERINIQQGQKVMRALKVICNAANMSTEYEQFRIRHSQILNTRKVSGELCLSIHPLDYATASDNAQGWSSCMSWAENGCYRAGTIEMMNSPMVICAYLRSSNNNIIISGQPWNSKKWRAWILVDEHGILCNRHYPYTNDSLATEVINWVTQLATERLGWEYEEDMGLLENDRRAHYRTDLMYNDISGNEWVRWAVNMPKDNQITICYSGPAMCMNCGEITDFRGNADNLICEDCQGWETCCDCGDSIDPDSAWTDDSGRVYCYDCYHDRFQECEHCGDMCEVEDVIAVGVHPDMDKVSAIVKNSWDVNSLEYGAWKKNYLWIWAPEDSKEYYFNYPSGHQYRVMCHKCLRKYGIDPDTDIIYDEDADIACKYNASHYSNLINPDRVSFETWAKVMNWPLNDERTALYRLMWNVYTEEIHEFFRNSD